MSQRRAWDMCQRGLRAAVHEELPCLGKVQINQRNEMKLVNRSHRFIGYCISLVWLQLPAKQDHSLNMRNCLKYCLVDKAWPRCNFPFELMITMTICLLTLLPPPTHRKRGILPSSAVGEGGRSVRRQIVIVIINLNGKLHLGHALSTSEWSCFAGSCNHTSEMQ